MALETRLVQKLSQNLLMTPQLQQAIKLLQLGRLEYIEAIEKELMDNPVLEEIREELDEHRKGKEEAGSDPSKPEKESENQLSSQKDENPMDWERYLENYGDYRGSTVPKGTFDFSDRPSVEATLTKAESLVDHIAEQLRMLEIEEGDQDIIMNIIGNLDHNGYLCCPIELLAEQCGCSEDHINRVRKMIADLDPPGLGAVDLRECLLIQLEHSGLSDSLEARIVDKYLDKLERRKYDQIAKLEEVAVEEVYAAVTAIQQLEPRPGRSFGEDDTRYVIPDIYVYKVSGEWVISLNEDGMPRLRVSPFYMKLLNNKEETSDSNKAYLNDRLKAASWLIKSIHQRQQTIYKVTESIVKHQGEFLENGIEHLKPMVLKDIAEDIGMHESTVSRVTTNKYVHTPQGVFELKFFFTTAIKTADGEVSSSSIKEKIKNIIADEDPKKPISDQKIVELLAAEDVKIARRTVAKYRESLGILSSTKRKKVF